MIEKVFPIILIALSLAASLVYFVKADPVHGTYWLAAAVLNVTTLWM